MNIHVDVDSHGNQPNNVNINVNNIINLPAPHDPIPAINNQNEEAEEEQPLRLDAFPRGKRILIAALSSVIFTILCILLASILPWFEISGGRIKYYSQDQFLWLFLLPPLSAVPLMFSSLALMGRICWLHCWTVTVISIDVPSAVIFVSFGASLVYSGVGIVLWTSGAFLVVGAHMSSIVGGLLFMKLAQIIELGPPPQEERPPVGPITVTIGAEDVTTQEELIVVTEVINKQPNYGGLQSPIGGGSA